MAALAATAREQQGAHALMPLESIKNPRRCGGGEPPVPRYALEWHQRVRPIGGGAGGPGIQLADMLSSGISGGDPLAAGRLYGGEAATQ